MKRDQATGGGVGRARRGHGGAGRREAGVEGCVGVLGLPECKEAVAVSVAVLGLVAWKWEGGKG